MTVACGHLLSSEEHFTELSTSGSSKYYLTKSSFLKTLFHKGLAFRKQRVFQFFCYLSKFLLRPRTTAILFWIPLCLAVLSF